MKADLAPWVPAALPAPAVAPMVELVTSDVACHLRMTGIDRRRRVAKYDITLANKAAASVAGRLYAVDRKREVHEYGMLDVAGSSMGRSCFDVPLRAHDGSRQMYIQVFGDGVHLFAEARPPVLRRARPWLRGALSLLAAGATLLGAAGFAGYAYEKPRVVAFAVPSNPAPGLVTAKYEVRGRAALNYRATAADGTVLGAGSLTAAAGSFSVVVPKSSAGQNVRVALDASGPLGGESRAVDMLVGGGSAAGAPAHVARIAALSAHRERYGGRSSVIVSYAAVADGGDIRIVDGRGAVVGRAPFAHFGTSRVGLNREVKDQALRTELAVRYGGSRASAVVEIPPDASGGAPRGGAAPAAGAPPATAAADSSAASSNDPFSVPGRVVSGQTFTVAIRTVLPNMRLALQDQIGMTIDEHAVPDGARSVTFTAPSTAIIDSYYLVCTYSRTSSEETLVRAVRVFPR